MPNEANKVIQVHRSELEDVIKRLVEFRKQLTNYVTGNSLKNLNESIGLLQQITIDPNDIPLLDFATCKFVSPNNEIHDRFSKETKEFAERMELFIEHTISVSNPENLSRRSVLAPKYHIPQKVSLDLRFWCVVWLPKQIGGNTLPMTKTTISFHPESRVSSLLNQLAMKCHRAIKVGGGYSSKTWSKVGETRTTSNPTEKSFKREINRHRDSTLTLKRKPKGEEKNRIAAAKLWGDSGDFLLRVAGLEDYLQGDVVLFECKSVREALRFGETITLVVEKRSRRTLPGHVQRSDDSNDSHAKNKLNSGSYTANMKDTDESHQGPGFRGTFIKTRAQNGASLSSFTAANRLNRAPPPPLVLALSHPITTRSRFEEINKVPTGSPQLLQNRFVKKRVSEYHSRTRNTVSREILGAPSSSKTGRQITVRVDSPQRQCTPCTASPVQSTPGTSRNTSKIFKNRPRAPPPSPKDQKTFLKLQTRVGRTERLMPKGVVTSAPERKNGSKDADPTTSEMKLAFGLWRWRSLHFMDTAFLSTAFQVKVLGIDVPNINKIKGGFDREEHGISMDSCVSSLRSNKYPLLNVNSVHHKRQSSFGESLNSSNSSLTSTNVYTTKPIERGLRTIQNLAGLSPIRVRTVLIVGEYVRKYTSWRTHTVLSSSHPRWDRILNGYGQGPLHERLSLNSVPFHARLAIFLCEDFGEGSNSLGQKLGAGKEGGSPPQRKETKQKQGRERVISYVVTPLVGTDGALLQGKKSLGLWPLSVALEGRLEEIALKATEKQNRGKKGTIDEKNSRTENTTLPTYSVLGKTFDAKDTLVESVSSRNEVQEQEMEEFGSKIARWLENIHMGILEDGENDETRGGWKLPDFMSFLIQKPPTPNSEPGAPILWLEFPKFVQSVWSKEHNEALELTKRIGMRSRKSIRPKPTTPRPGKGVLASTMRTVSREQGTIAYGTMLSKISKTPKTHSSMKPGGVASTNLNNARIKTPGMHRSRSEIPNLKLLMGKIEVANNSQQNGTLRYHSMPASILQPLKLDHTSRFEQLVMDPILLPSRKEGEYLFSVRKKLYADTKVLPKILSLVDWCDNKHSQALALDILRNWKMPSHILCALPLLFGRFSCPLVRSYAVACLKRVTDEEIVSILPQLLCALHTENHHWSPLACLLVERAVKNPDYTGFILSWYLRASLSESLVRERGQMMLGVILNRCVHLRAELDRSMQIWKQVSHVATEIARIRSTHTNSKVELTSKLRSFLEKLNEFMDAWEISSLPLPYDPRIRVGRFRPGDCKYLTSKKTPLWLTFEPPKRISSNFDDINGMDGASDLEKEHQEVFSNNLDVVPATECPLDNKNIRCIFKAGDDLRQDVLTIQALRLMDQIWLKDGLDLRLRTYACIATEGPINGGGMGFIQVVENAMTKGAIQREYGGRTGAFKQNVILRYLEDNNNRKTDLLKALDNYKRSLAGYCVASYVLGLGDRHSDNVMIKADGHLFHIDFGNFLGNFKSKWGIRREREAFLLTPAMAYPMGGPKWKTDEAFEQFKTLCVQAFLSIRTNASKLLNLLEGVMPANMPQLNCVTDLQYVRDRLAFEQTPKKAKERFLSEIQRSLGTAWRRIDDFIHDNVHFN